MPGIEATRVPRGSKRRLVMLMALLAALAALVVRGDSPPPTEPPPEAERSARGSSPAGSSSGAPAAPGLTSTAAPGALRLEGQIVDEDERPIAGATVTLAGPAAALAVETEADGAFAFDDLAEGLYTVIADKGELYAEDQAVRLDDTSDPVILTLKRGPTLVIHVTDDRGRAFAGATVEVSSSRSAVTGDDGTVRMRGVDLGHEYVAVTAGGRARARERVDTGDDPAQTIERTIVLVPGAAIAGTVIDQDGHPVPEAYVEIEARDGNRRETTVADAHGAWQVADLARGSHVARASSDTHVATPDLVFEHDGVHPTAGIVVRVETGAQIAGIVVDGAGKPIAEARVSAGGRVETTDAAGRFVARGLVADTYEVSASTTAMGGATRQVVLARAQHAEVTIVLSASTIAGVVVDARGEPVEGALVFAKSADPHGYNYERTDERGRFDLGGLAPGDYELTAQRPDSRVETAPLKVATTNRRVRLVVQDRAGITGRVVLDGQPVAYYGVTIDPDPAVMFDTPTPVRDPAGRFTQRDATPGTMAVVIVGPGFARRTLENVQVIAGRVTDLGDIVVDRGGRVRGRVVDERGAGIAGATVEISARWRSTSTDRLRALLRGDLSARTDATGAYQIDGVVPSDDDRRIEASHPALGSSGARPFAAGEAEVELVIAATGSIDGTVAGHRPGTVLVMASRVDDNDAQYRGELDPAGAFHFAQLPPGEYEVRLRSGHDARSLRATVVAGARTVVAFDQISIEH